jgi:hypothetical protein
VRHGPRVHDGLGEGLQPVVEHDRRGVALLKLAQVLRLVDLPQLVVPPVLVELLVDAPKGLLDGARERELEPDHLGRSLEVGEEGEDHRVLVLAHELRRRLDAGAVHPAHEGAAALDLRACEGA